MENSCRLCLSNAFDLSSVFQFKNGLLVVDLIKNVVPEITIVRSDRLSKLICGTCLDGVVSAYDLRTISIENDKKMQLEMQDVRHYLNFEVKAEPDDSLVKDEEFYDDYHAGDGSDDYQNISKMYDLKEVSVVLNRNEADQASSTDQIKAEFTCIYCASSFYEPTLLVDHVAQDHNINSKDLVCDICNKQGNFKIFKTKTKIAEHMALCHTESGTTKALSKKAKEKHEEIKCEYCPQLFKTQSARYAHKKRKHSNENTWKQCSECPLRFRSQNKFEVHVRRKHDKTPKKTTKCDICLEVFKSYADLKLHSYIHVDYVEKFHPSEPHLYSCSLCGFYCYNDAELQVHLQTHQGDFKTKKIIVCVKCSWTFKDFDFLVAHTKKHNEIPTHRCLKCLKTFVFGKKLLKHLQKYQEAFVCDVCGHVESIKLRLEQHIRCVHMKEVFFLCPTCGVSKKSNVALKSHMQVHHSTEMKYKCLLCPKVFRTPAYYRNHQSVHSNEAVS